MLTVWQRLSRSPWGLVACIVLQLLLTEYSADIQGLSTWHATKFSFIQYLFNEKSAPRELPLRVQLLRSSKEPFHQVMLIVWWRERIRTIGPRKYWKHYKNILPISLAARSAATCLLELQVQIPPWRWLAVCCECCVFAGSSLCDGLITRPETTYQVLCVWVWSRHLNSEVR